MDLKKPNDRFRISHPDGSVTALDDFGHVVGWTECGAAGWSAFWHSRAGDRRVFADNNEAAAVALYAGIAEERA